MDQNELALRIAGLALLRGEFTLRSGRKSSYYLDKYRFTTIPEVLSQLGPMLAERAARIAGAGGLDRLAGAELGGIPLVTAAGLSSGLPMVLVRNAKKEYGTAKQVEGVLERGDRVVFLEDVATTGGQAIEAVGVLRELGAEVLGVVAVIDRCEGARANVEAEGVVFDALFTPAQLGVDG